MTTTLMASLLIGLCAGSVSAKEWFNKDSFVARFILCFDVWATDHVGFFVEGGGLVAEEDSVEGVGVFTFGAQYGF